jgi:hypothetical protein
MGTRAVLGGYSQGTHGTLSEGTHGVLTRTSTCTGPVPAGIPSTKKGTSTVLTHQHVRVPARRRQVYDGAAVARAPAQRRLRPSAGGLGAQERREECGVACNKWGTHRGTHRVLKRYVRSA